MNRSVIFGSVNLMPAGALRKNGFTALEIIIVVVIIGILAASIGYRTLSTTGTSYVVAVDQVIADIQYVQVLAMSTLQQQSITFTNGSVTYNMAGETRVFPGGVAAGNTVTFTFNSLGEPVVGGDQTLGVGSVQIRVLAITGKIEEL